MVKTHNYIYNVTYKLDLVMLMVLKVDEVIYYDVQICHFISIEYVFYREPMKNQKFV